VLSPKFYWVRKATLPVKKIYQAKKIVPSFFSDILPEGDYKYKIIKKDNEFLLFAYQENKIIEAIKKSGIDMALVNKIFFSQIQFSTFGAIDIGHECILSLRDDIVIKTPKFIFLEDVPTIDIQYAIRNITKSRTFITVGDYAKKVSLNISNKLIWLLSFIMIFYFIEYIFIKNEITQLVLEKEKVIKTYKLPASSIQLKSILQSLNKKRTQSINSRKNLALLLQTPIKDGDILKKVSFKLLGKKQTFFIQIVLDTKENSSIYKDYLVKNFKVRSAKVDNLIMTIRGEL
jgi:hypothetical protein